MVPILKTIKKVPGGLMVVPLFLGCIINTFFPAALKIGSFTTALTQANPMMAIFFVCTGAGMSFKEAPRALKTGAVITIVKFATGVAIGLAVAHLMNDNLLGLSSLAIIAAMTNSNGGLYCALTGAYGTRTEVGAYVVTAINDGPFLTMLALGTAGLANIPFMSLVACVIPLIVGMILGNLDHEMREFLTKGSDALIMFFAFALGSGLSFGQLIKGGLSGIFLGVMTCLLGGVILIFFDLITGGTGVAGAALSSTAGNAASVPAAVADVDPSLAAISQIATPQVAGSVLTTAILTPQLLNFYRKLSDKYGWGKKALEKIKAEEAAVAAGEK